MQQDIVKERKRILGVVYHRILDIPPVRKYKRRDLILKYDVVKIILDAMTAG